VESRFQPPLRARYSLRLSCGCLRGGYRALALRAQRLCWPFGSSVRRLSKYRRTDEPNGQHSSDHASLIVGVASSRSLVSGLREHPPLTHAAGRGTMPMTVLGGALPVPCTRNPGYASLNARLRPVPVRTERRVMTPMVRVLVRRSPVNPVRSEEAAVSGQLRVPRGGLAGATTLATGGRVGTMRAHGHSHPCVTPPTPHPASSGRAPTGHACECRR